MTRGSRRRRRSVTSTTLDDSAAMPRRSYGRWRAASLMLVYLLFAAHIVHWKLSGRTLAPLELNEVMYTLELGIITAGFLFMCVLLLGTLIFGRFFCSWACHILALQDLCAWILRKFRIRQKPIRSRLLLFVPPLVAAYMFLWPQIVRTWRRGALPEFHFRTDAEGWASLATTDFWRNLPGPWIIALTFVVCGFMLVYVLGTRTFCTYVCPYGAIFGLADRVAPGRIRVSDACRQCGTCTAVCTSGVRVHEEVDQHGMVVNPACLKDLDCVAACPQGALRYSFGKPSLLRSYRSGGRFGRLPYDFSLFEELCIGLVFLAAVLIFRGLYGAVPFLLALALGAIIGYASVVALRLHRRREVKFARFALKSNGQFNPSGWVFAGMFALLTAFIGHSAFIRYHEFTGLSWAAQAHTAPNPEQRLAAASAAMPHLAGADRWSLFRNLRVERELMHVALQLEDHDTVARYARRVLQRDPADAHAHFILGRSFAVRNLFADAARHFHSVIIEHGATASRPHHLVASAHQSLAEFQIRRGQYAPAADHLRAAVEIDPRRALAHAELGSVLAELGQFEQAVSSLREAARLDPSIADTHYNLGTILSYLGRSLEAVDSFGHASELEPDSVLIHNNLGFALLRLGQLDRADTHLQRALALAPDNADAHFNLANLLVTRGQTEEAGKHFRTAARLDARYARFLGSEIE